MIDQKRYFFIIVGLALLVIRPIICRADFGRNIEATEKVGGTIPVIHKIFVAGEGRPDLFSSVTSEDLHNGFKEINKEMATLTVLANAPWKVSARAEFKPVGSYIKPASDLLIKIKDRAVIEEGWGSGGTFNKSFVNFGPLSNEDQVLWMNDKSGDHCLARVYYRMLLSASRDIPGEYSVTVIYTISAP